MVLLCLIASEKRERRKAQTKTARKPKNRAQDLSAVVVNSGVVMFSYLLLLPSAIAFHPGFPLAGI